MERQRLGSGAAGAITLVLTLVACAPRSKAPTEGVEGTGAGAGAGQAKNTLVTYEPVPVHVTISKQGDGCEIEVSSPEVVLRKDPAKGANKAVWTWSGADYESVWVSVPPNDLRACFDLDSLKGDSAKKGFQIVMPDGTRKTVDPADTCKPGSYTYEIGARGKQGTPDCGADPTVKILD